MTDADRPRATSVPADLDPGDPPPGHAVVAFRSPRRSLWGHGEAVRIDVPAPWPEHVGVVADTLAELCGSDDVSTPGSGPVAFAALKPIARWFEARPKLLALLERRGADQHRKPVSSTSTLQDHAIVVGYGRVGGAIGPVLKQQGLPFAVIERDHLMLTTAQSQGIPTIEGDAALPAVLQHAGVERARLIAVATPDSFQARRIVEVARQLNPGIDVVVRTHSEEEFRTLESLGAGRVVMG